MPPKALVVKGDKAPPPIKGATSPTNSLKSPSPATSPSSKLPTVKTNAAAGSPKKGSAAATNAVGSSKLPSLKGGGSPTAVDAVLSAAAEEEQKKKALLKEEEERMKKEIEDERIRVEEEERVKAEEAARAKAEEARLRQLEEEKRREEDRIRLAKMNGEVKLIYEMYNEMFPIKDGSTTAAIVDDTYALSFVMPKCVIHLSSYAPKEKRKREEEGDIDVFVKENPRGVYQGLEANATYYVYVEQEAQQLARDQERMRRVAAHMDGAPAAKDPLAKKDDGRAFESCSCIEGNPCVDEYGCRDWSSRFAIAKKNGWKGF